MMAYWRTRVADFSFTVRRALNASHERVHVFAIFHVHVDSLIHASLNHTVELHQQGGSS